MNKRTLILLLILITLIVGAAIWWWLAPPLAEPTPAPIDPGQAFPVSPPLPPPAAGTTSLPSLPPPAHGSSRLITLSERAVAGAAIISDRVLFLERDTGLIVEMDLADRARRELARLPIRAPIAEAILTLDAQKLSVWFSVITSGQK